MACDNSVNHKNFFKAETEVTAVDVEPIVEETIIVDEPVVEKNEPLYTEQELYGYNKQEQSDILNELGVSKNNIKKLKYEKDRVDKILELI